MTKPHHVDVPDLGRAHGQPERSCEQWVLQHKVDEARPKDTGRSGA